MQAALLPWISWEKVFLMNRMSYLSVSFRTHPRSHRPQTPLPPHWAQQSPGCGHSRVSPLLSAPTVLSPHCIWEHGKGRLPAPSTFLACSRHSTTPTSSPAILLLLCLHVVTGFCELDVILEEFPAWVPEEKSNSPDASQPCTWSSFLVEAGPVTERQPQSSSESLSLLAGTERRTEESSTSSMGFLGFSSRFVLIAPDSDNFHSNSSMVRFMPPNTRGPIN